MIDDSTSLISTTHQALEQYSAVKEKEREQNALLDEARKEALQAAQMFDQVSEKGRRPHTSFTF